MTRANNFICIPRVYTDGITQKNLNIFLQKEIRTQIIEQIIFQHNNQQHSYKQNIIQVNTKFLKKWGKYINKVKGVCYKILILIDVIPKIHKNTKKWIIWEIQITQLLKNETYINNNRGLFLSRPNGYGGNVASKTLQPLLLPWDVISNAHFSLNSILLLSKNPYSGTGAKTRDI